MSDPVINNFRDIFDKMLKNQGAPKVLDEKKTNKPVIKSNKPKKVLKEAEGDDKELVRGYTDTFKKLAKDKIPDASNDNKPIPKKFSAQMTDVELEFRNALKSKTENFIKTEVLPLINDYKNIQARQHLNFPPRYTGLSVQTILSVISAAFKPKR